MNSEVQVSDKTMVTTRSGTNTSTKERTTRARPASIVRKGGEQSGRKRARSHVSEKSESPRSSKRLKGMAAENGLLDDTKGKGRPSVLGGRTRSGLSKRTTSSVTSSTEPDELDPDFRVVEDLAGNVTSSFLISTQSTAPENATEPISSQPPPTSTVEAPPPQETDTQDDEDEAHLEEPPLPS